MSEDESRDHEPTQKKLDDARTKGDLPRSADLTGAMVMLAFAGVALFAGAGLLAAFGRAAAGLIEGIGAPGRTGAAGGAVLAMLWPTLPFLLVPALAAALSIAAQRAWVFAPKKLQPDLKRLGLIANAGRRFGRQGMVEFAKNVAKLVATAALAGWFIATSLPELLLAGRIDGRPAAVVPVVVLGRFLVLAAGLALAFGAIDYLWQFFDFRRRNRMSHQELKEEFREAEGDPHMKGERRARARAIAMNRMLADVAKADVVIVNPTHYAVALRWARGTGRAPVCVAKGTDAVAARIRERAAVHGIPIRSDPPTARSLHATVEIGREIGRDQYAAVAAAIRYAEKMRAQVRARGF